MAIDLARSMVGRHEIGDRQAIQEYLKNGGVNLDPATRAWCAAFVNATLEQSGIKGTGSNLARSFLKWGEATDKPEIGDLAVFSRGDPNGWQGHVGFFQGINPDGSISVLGGNQGDSVSVANYPVDRLLGYRRASTPVANGFQQAMTASAPQTTPPSAPSPRFGDFVAPQPAPVAPDLGMVMAAALQNRQRAEEARAERDAAEATRRRALLGDLFA